MHAPQPKQNESPNRLVNVFGHRRDRRGGNAARAGLRRWVSQGAACVVCAAASAGPPTATCWLDEVPLINAWIEDLVVLDLNADGLPDVLYQDGASGEYGAALGDGAGGFAHLAPEMIAGPDLPFDVLRAIDLDGDGDDDLLLQRSVWINTTPHAPPGGKPAPVSFARAPVTLTANFDVDRVWGAEDLDGDGVAELLILDGYLNQTESQGRGISACRFQTYALTAFLCRLVPDPAGGTPTFEPIASRGVLNSRESLSTEPGCQDAPVGFIFPLTGEGGVVPEQTAPNSVFINGTAYVTLQFPGRKPGTNDRAAPLLRLPVTIGGIGNFESLLFAGSTRSASHAVGDFLGTGGTQVFAKKQHDLTLDDTWMLFDLETGSLIDSTPVASATPAPPVDWNLDGLPDLPNTINDGSPGFPLGGGINLLTNTVAWADFNSDGYPDRVERLNEDGQQSHIVVLSGPTPDYNADGVGDACQPTPDENGNGRNDWEEIWFGDAPDCNGNLRLDSAELADFSVQDCNQNGLPDSCELADLPALDADGDGILDDCVPRWTPVPLDITLDGWVRDRYENPRSWNIATIGLNGWTLAHVIVGPGNGTRIYIRHNTHTGETDVLESAPYETFYMINGLGEVALMRSDTIAGKGYRLRVFYWAPGDPARQTTLDEIFDDASTDVGFDLHESGWFIAEWALSHIRAAPRLINARTGEIRLLDSFEDYDAAEGTLGMYLTRIAKDGRIFGRRWRSGSGTPTCVLTWAGPFAPIETINCSAWECKPNGAFASATGVSALWTAQAYGPCGGWRAIGNRVYDAYGNEFGSRVIDNPANPASRADFDIDTILDGGQIIASPSTTDGEKVVVVWPTLDSDRYFDVRDLLTGDPHGVSFLGIEGIYDWIDNWPNITDDGSFRLRPSGNAGRATYFEISYPAPPGLDLTADGETDDADLLALARFLAGQGPEPAGDADLNQDSSIDEDDAQALAWWLIASRADVLPDCDRNGTPDLAELARFGGTLPDADNDLVPDGCVPPGCNLADLAPPLGLHDLADVVAFVDGFAAGDTALDFDGSGLLDLADIVAFVTAFGAGCP